MKFIKKCKSSTCEGRTPCKNIVWKQISWEVALQKRIWGPVGNKWDISQQCALLAKITKYILGCIGSSTASRLRENTILPHSGLIGPHLGHCVQFGTGQNRTLMNWSEFSRTSPQRHGARALWGSMRRSQKRFSQALPRGAWCEDESQHA